MFSRRMKTPAIPERVFYLCKNLEDGPVADNELRKRMEPPYLHQNTKYFTDYREVAEELNLISISDHMVSLIADPDDLVDMECFRKYVNRQLCNYQNGPFYKVTKAYFDMGDEVLALQEKESFLILLAQIMQEKINCEPPIDAGAIRAWRFWVSFLGFGCLEEPFFMPNARVFLEDVLGYVHFEKNQHYSFSTFISDISPYAQIIIDGKPEDKQLSYGVSNGLRSLHDAGLIRMERFLDQKDIWSLYPQEAHPISRTVTNIIFL